MAVPRNRISNAKKNSRRAHDASKSKILAKCSNCGVFCLPHRACQDCGYYKGKSVFEKSVVESE